MAFFLWRSRGGAALKDSNHLANLYNARGVYNRLAQAVCAVHVPASSPIARGVGHDEEVHRRRSLRGLAAAAAQRRPGAAVRLLPHVCARIQLAEPERRGAVAKRARAKMASAAPRRRLHPVGGVLHPGAQQAAICALDL